MPYKLAILTGVRRCLFVILICISLIISDIEHLLVSSGDTLCPPSDVYIRSFLCPFFSLIKLCYTKALKWSSLVPGPEVKSSSSGITSPTPFTHCKLSSWGLVQDLQDKVRMLRALASVLSQYACFLLYFTNSTVCLCKWMTCPAWSKWWALLCGFAVPPNDWRQPPKGEPCWGFILTCQCQETHKVPARGAARNGQSMWTELSFLGYFFLLSLTIPWLRGELELLT